MPSTQQVKSSEKTQIAVPQPVAPSYSYATPTPQASFQSTSAPYPGKDLCSWRQKGKVEHLIKVFPFRGKKGGITRILCVREKTILSVPLQLWTGGSRAFPQLMEVYEANFHRSRFHSDLKAHDSVNYNVQVINQSLLGRKICISVLAYLLKVWLQVSHFTASLFFFLFIFKT